MDKRNCSNYDISFRRKSTYDKRINKKYDCIKNLN